MEIVLKQIDLQNFKGIRELSIPFNERLTNIFGANATGKTTIMDAFLWLLFGKDSLDRQAFEIKTLDADNQPIRKLLHKVEAVLLVDGMKKTLAKEYREKWVKKRGEEKEQFSGHETDHFVDGVPVSKRDYEAVINGLITEEIFKLVSSPFYFANQKWEYKRKLVTDIAGEPTIQDVSRGNKDFAKLADEISGRTIEDYISIVKHEIKNVKKQLQDIPARIDEHRETMPDNEDIEKLQSDLELITKEVAAVQEKINNRQEALKDKHEQQKKLSEEFFTQKNHLGELTDAFKEKVNQEREKEIEALRDDITALKSKLYNLNETKTSVRYLEETKKNLMEQRDNLLAQYKEESAKTFEIDDNDTTCYACGQELPDADDKVEKLKADFLVKQGKRKEDIKARGTELRGKIEDVQEQIVGLQGKLEGSNEDSINAKIEELSQTIEQKKSKELPEYTSDIKDIQKVVDALGKKMDTFEIIRSDDSDLKEKIKGLELSRDEILGKISVQNERLRIEERIEELEKKERTYSKKLADLERKLFVIDKFQKKKMELMDKSIREKFGDVQFKMYKQLINGGEEPTCEILIDGVPFDNANRAAQINTGIKIINAFNNHYGYTTPIFVDNAEAVNELTTTSSQLIRLVVVEPDFVYPEFEDNHGIVLKPLK